MKPIPDVAGNGVLVSYSISFYVSQVQSCFSNAKPQKSSSGLLVAESNCFFQGCDGLAYNVNFHEDNEDAPLTIRRVVSSLHVLS